MTEPRTTIAVDTSQVGLKISIARGDQLLFSGNDHSGLPHSQQLFPLLLSALHELHLSFSSIDCFAINTGPGSFTGLRVGIAALKAIASTLHKPLLGINLLDLIAYQSRIPIAPQVILLHAARGEFYYGVRKLTPNQQVQKIEEDRVLPLTTLIDLLAVNAANYKYLYLDEHSLEIFSSQVSGKPWKIIPPVQVTSDAIALWANKQAPSVLREINAYYIRPSDAESKLGK